MPITPTYPGVYIEELPSSVRTITGVATSITAFIGRALRGPTNDPILTNSYADFERVFGGLWVESSLGYAVRDFFLNGGAQALIVRLYHAGADTAAAQAVATAAAGAVSAPGATPDSVATAARTKANTFAADPAKTAADKVAVAAETAKTAPGATPASVSQTAADKVATAAPASKATLGVGGLNLTAAYEGKWGASLLARIDEDVNPAAPDKADLFNLSVKDKQTGVIEVFRNLSFRAGHPRQVNKVLENESQLVRSSLPGAKPTASAAAAPGKDPFDDAAAHTAVTATVSDGTFLDNLDFTGPGQENAKQGLYALRKADLFNLLCIPPFLDPNTGSDFDASILDAAASYCKKRRAMLIVDPPMSWTTKDKAKTGFTNSTSDIPIATKDYAALFFPRLRQPNPLRGNQLEDFAPCGAVAGTFARIDTSRGVWKAPAGLEATLAGVPALSVPLTDAENGELNPLGINCLRTMPAAGRVIWGSRTLDGDDRLASQWKYIPVRRTALFIEESLYRGTQWIVFEPNDEPLWASIRLNLGAFMQDLFRKGAFQGTTPKEAYFVKCDKETTTQNDINLGIVNIIVGFAPLKPAEFVIIKIQQIAGQLAT